MITRLICRHASRPSVKTTPCNFRILRACALKLADRRPKRFKQVFNMANRPEGEKEDFGSWLPWSRMWGMALKLFRILLHRQVQIPSIMEEEQRKKKKRGLYLRCWFFLDAHHLLRSVWWAHQRCSLCGLLRVKKRPQSSSTAGSFHRKILFSYPSCQFLESPPCTYIKA